MSSKSTAFPLGTYVGNPDGNGGATEDQFNAQMQSFVNVMGTTPEFMDAYIDPGMPVDQWASNASWTAWSWAQTPVANQTTPVIGLPMNLNENFGNPDAMFAAFASGQYDDVLRQMVANWKQEGFNTQYWRPGYEMNSGSQAWYAGGDSQTAANYVAAFQHIADVLHEAGQADGANVQVVWSPNVQNWNAVDVNQLYPGDNYVDVIGPDGYDMMWPPSLYDWGKNDGTYDSTLQQWESNPVNVVHYLNYPGGNQWNPTGAGSSADSFTNLIDMAKEHGKAFAVSETGAGGDSSSIPDDTIFPQWLASTLQNAENEGVAVKYVNIWDDNASGNWDFTSPDAGKPDEAAAWAQYFGAGSGSGGDGSGSGSGGNALTLNVSEDAYQGNAQITVAIDGAALGGATTITALHDAGQTQSISSGPDLAAGPHTVTVNFLNDLYGGTPQADRNVYLDNVSSGGVTTQIGDTMWTNGQVAFVAPGQPTDTPVTLGSGPDQIVVRASEDAWQGPADVVFSVDGQQVGGTESVTAAHAAGQSQAFILNGNFGSGPLVVSADFVNDAYGGSADTDRNLYIDSITGSSMQTENAELMWSGTQDFTIAGAGNANSQPQMAFITTATLVAPSGDATLLAAPSETLDFTAGSFGHDILSGFDTTTDVIALSSQQVSSYGALLGDAQANDGGTLITLDPNHSIQIAGVDPGALTSSNFAIG